MFSRGAPDASAFNYFFVKKYFLIFFIDFFVVKGLALIPNIA